MVRNACMKQRCCPWLRPLEFLRPGELWKNEHGEWLSSGSNENVDTTIAEEGVVRRYSSIRVYNVSIVKTHITILATPHPFFFSEVEEEVCSVCPKMTYQQRIGGCVSFMLLGFLLSLGSLTRYPIFVNVRAVVGKLCSKPNVILSWP